MGDRPVQKVALEDVAPDVQPLAPASASEIEALVSAHENGLLRYAHRMLRSRESAQDIVQDAFVRYLRKPLAYGEPRQRVAWLYRVTHNLCIDLIKRESKRGDVYDRVDKPELTKLPVAGLLAAEKWDRLDRLLHHISKDQRTVIVLFFQEDLSYKEIAEVTGFSMSNVGMLLHRGLKKLRTAIDEEGYIES